MKNKSLKIILMGWLLTLGLGVFAFADATWETNTGAVVTAGNISTQLPQILINTGTNTIYISGYIQTWGINTWNNSDTNSGDIELEDTVVVEINTTPVDLETEFANALFWMYSNWMTMYDNKEDYRMYDLLTREEASKIIWKAYSTLGYADVVKNSSCNFLDSDIFDTSLSSHISDVCKRWLFKWSDGKYMPKDNLTKAQWMAVLIRMFEWKLSYELQIPWREQYYTKWKLIWLTNIDNINEFDTKLTRYEIALMIYRLKNIATNAQLKASALNKLWQVTVKNDSWSMDSSTIIDNLGTLMWWIDPYQDPELLEAIYWMFDNWLTIYNNPNTYRPFDTLNRAWTAKIFDIFSDMLGLSVNQSLSVDECTFSDIWNLDLNTQKHIVNICKKWIIKWNNNLFSPNTNINKSHFVVSLIRMFQWKYLDENTNPWWQNYFNEAKELGIVSPSDAITFDTPISRYEVALFLYKFNIKYKMLSSLNNTRVENEVLSTVPWSISTGSNWKLMANVYVDSNLLKQWSFNIGYIEIFGTRYKIVKSSESTYFTENFVRYGDVFDLATDEKLWTINFVVSNGYIVESMIRFVSGENYKTLPVKWTNTYYSIKGL